MRLLQLPKKTIQKGNLFVKANVYEPSKIEFFNYIGTQKTSLHIGNIKCQPCVTCAMHTHRITNKDTQACVERERERLTTTPKMVLDANKYRKFPINSRALLVLI